MRTLSARERAAQVAATHRTLGRIAHGLWLLKVEGWFLDAMQAARKGDAFAPLRPVLTEQELADRACKEFGFPPGAGWAGAQDPWPPFPVGAHVDYAALKRYAGNRLVAEMLLAGEMQDAAVFGAATGPLTDPQELWAKAQRIVDEETRLERDLAPLRAVEQRGGQPGPVAEALARMEANFGEARQACLTGHSGMQGVTCTYGGLTPTGGYWLAADACQQGHGETCQLRAACEGAPTETRFSGWGDGFIWGVYACQACAETFRQVHPEWRVA